MTGNSNKTRAVILAALMVFSVFAGTVAFTGSAAADDAPTYGGNAVHYDNGSDPVIEVPFEEGAVDINTVNNDSITLLDDGEEKTEYVEKFEYRNGAVYIVLNETIPSNDLEVDISSNVASPGTTENVTNPGEKSVVFAGQTLEFTGSTDAPNSPDNSSAYQGSTVAISTEELGEGIDVTVEGEDNTYFTEGSTGTNSTVFTFDTSDRELGEYRVFLQGNDTDANRTFVTVRDLRLDVEVDDLNVSTEDSIEGTVSAVAGGREVDIDLLDSSGDSLNTTTVDLDGQGEYDFEFDAATADEGSTLDTGDYTVEVTDTTSGVSTESSEITVSEAADEDVNFASNAISEQRGDILEATIELTSTSEATLTFGSEDDGVRANATVNDDDGDDEVTVYINTYNFLNGEGDVYSLDSDSDDEILDQNKDLDLNNNLIDAGDYDFEVQAGDQGVATGVTNSDDVATVTLQDRNTENLRMWTGSSGEIGSLSDLEDVNEALENGEITQSSEIAVGDLAVHQLEASGLEGALDARDNEQITDEFLNLEQNGPINLTIEEASPGANQEASALKLDSSNVTVIADGTNDTYFVVVDTGEMNFDAPRSEALPDDEDTSLETNFTVINDDDATISDFTNNENYDDDENEETLVTWTAAEPDLSVSTPYNVSASSDQAVSGTTNIAPGTELSLRIRSQEGTSPSFLKTASPVVQSDGTWSATLDFSEQSVGDEYDIIVTDELIDDVEESGTVVEAVETDTATPEPDTDTPEPDTDTPEPDTDTPEPDTDTPEPDTETSEPTETSTPGFGVVVALTALLAAALLATRRD